MCPEITQLDTGWKVVSQEGPGRVREEHLATVPGARDPAGAMNVQADVRAGAQARVAGVQSHAHAKIDAPRPRLRGERALRGHRRRDGARCRREPDEKGVALGSDLPAVMCLEGGAEQCVVALQHRRPTARVGLEQARRPLDIAEQEGDGTGEELGHWWPECAADVASGASARPASSHTLR
ncbi:MAG: hypothetical protein H0W98_00460 [Chloroflexi bacterium]|nr:hypothetical protein [Chloroflexota bacterium]